MDEDVIEASFSSFLMHTITMRIEGVSGSRESEPDMIDAGVMARLDRSVHRPFVRGASAVMALEYPANVYHRYAVLTPLDHPFAAVFGVREKSLDDQEVEVVMVTTEPPACVADDKLLLAQTQPQTFSLLSRWLGLIIGLDDDDDTSSSPGGGAAEGGGGNVSTHDHSSASHDTDTEDDDTSAIANTEDAAMAVAEEG
ncbi:unnamed protein product [Vitrella brassicaformis CCMP3155]|uniref:Uncharacterized protein n=1 Tax=Vitrella brassicaformis (strain CCMP3155) TaxID=1169540 RepID=A0A0G4FCT4_VITBC|nr:unnamed protein product [Vitrella brassicaformis CCMP3155]|eukprot:CEM10722.1 unnamed protein product [Vitrella brassicaformis CCMP3155]